MVGSVRVLVAFCVVAVLSACSIIIEPYGVWEGDVFYKDGDAIGSIWVNYDSRSWVWCVDECFIGDTSGWNLVDSWGRTMEGNYSNGYVNLRLPGWDDDYAWASLHRSHPSVE